MDHYQTDRINAHDDYACEYDALVDQYHSHTHDVLFGMCYEYVRPGETLLDFGIGTGLSSVHFARAGLEVSGMDASESMLRECRKKGITRELTHHDMMDLPWPYDDRRFSCVISCGVLQFFNVLDEIFAEAIRILKPGGIFAFTVIEPSQDEFDHPGEEVSPYIEVPTCWGMNIYKHSDEYLQSLVQGNSLSLLKEQKILTQSGEESEEDVLIKIIVTRRVL